jgi:hypothetical protein
MRLLVLSPDLLKSAVAALAGQRKFVYLEKRMHIMVSTCEAVVWGFLQCLEQAKQQLLNTSGLSSWLVHSLAGLQ